jgi:hypothetical protein
MKRRARKSSKTRKSRDGPKQTKPGKGGDLLPDGKKKTQHDPAPLPPKVNRPLIDPINADERSQAIDNLIGDLNLEPEPHAVDGLIEELDLEPDRNLNQRGRTTVFFPGSNTRHTVPHPPKDLIAAVAQETIKAGKNSQLHSVSLPLIGRVSLGSSSARRLQTAAVFSFSMYSLALLLSLCSFWSLVLLLFPLTTPFMLGYLLWIVKYDDAPTTGSREPLLRGRTDGVWWSSFCDYFPITLIKTAPLPPTDKYVLGYHPHGIISVGAFGALATNGARVLDLTGGGNAAADGAADGTNPAGGEQRGFDSLFPGVRPRLITLPINFIVPFVREYLLSLGLLNSSRDTFRNVLKQGPGAAVVVVVGGAKEATYVEPGGDIHLVLEKRRGFVREAILGGAKLVPVIAFGENDVYHKLDLADSGEGSAEGSSYSYRLISTVQHLCISRLGFSLPLFRGRSVFCKDVGLMPLRKPINVVVGAPIHPPPLTPLQLASFAPKFDRATGAAVNDDARVVERVHREYVQAIKALYQQHKDAVWRTPAVKGGGEKNGAQKATQKVLYNLPGLQRSGTLTTS